MSSEDAPLPEASPTKTGLWLDQFLDRSAPWLDGELLDIAEAPDGEASIGYQATRRVKRGGKTFRRGDFVPCQDIEELRKILTEDPDVRRILLPGCNRWVPAHLAEPSTEQVDLKKYRAKILRSMRGMVFQTGVFIVLFFATRSLTVLLFALMFGIFPIIDRLLDFFQRPDQMSVDERNRRRVNAHFFFRWLDTRNATWLWVMLGVLLALLGMQYSVGIYKSVELAGTVKADVRAGEWWRMVTAGLLHGDILHFLFNGLALYSLGRLVLVLSNPSRLVIVFFLSIVGGSLASVLLVPNSLPGVGASGGILGVLGYLCVHTYRFKKQIPRRLQIGLYRSVFMISLLGVLGAAFIDNAAHGGGFVTGVLLGLLAYKAMRLGNEVVSERTRIVGWICTGILVLGIIQVVRLFVPYLGAG